MIITKVVLEEPANYENSQPDQDGLWKNLIFELFKEFMEFFAPDLYNKIDFTRKPDFLQQELFQEVIEEKKGRAYTDQIVKVFMKNGDERWILVHIEVQGIAGEEFAQRMFRYFYRIYDKFDREIYSIALLTDASVAKHYGRFYYSFYGTKLEYSYNVYKFYGKNIQELEQSNNPFAHAVIAGIYASKTRNNAEQRYIFKRRLMIQMLEKFPGRDDTTRTYLSALFYFIDYLLKVPNEFKKKLTDEIRPLLNKEAVQNMRAEKSKLPPTIAELFAESREEGREEGREVGKLEAAKVFAQKLIRGKFTDSQIAELTELDVEEVMKIRKSMES